MSSIHILNVVTENCEGVFRVYVIDIEGVYSSATVK